MKRANFRQGGFTLVELVFVIAIIVVLASIFLPLAISKLSKADEAVTDASIQEIAAALTSFYDDLRHFPTCDSLTACSPFPGDENNIVFLAFGDGFGDLSATYPTNTAASTQWDLANNDEASVARNNAANHLMTNDPNVNGTSAGAGDYATSGSKRWRGPYIARVAVDAWARTFIAYVGAMEDNGQKVTGGGANDKGWILSAGPNNSLDTTPTHTTLQVDDRGFIFHTD
jgi:prepilin-type N-terminal cleavage/methylation domain-containing protein